MKIARKSTLVVAILATTYSQAAFAVCIPMVPCAKISSLQDVDFGVWSGTGQLQATYDMCAYVADDDETDYTITAKGNGPADALEITNGTDALPVQVSYTQRDPITYESLVTNVASTFSIPHSTEENCVGALGLSGKVRVNITELDMQSVTSGTYSAYVRLTLKPD
jgi:hypothetical protein